MTAPHRAGVAALLGRPNAGKSTLQNRLLGEKLSIVSAKPQTTRSRLLGILGLEGAQLLLLDTPGLPRAARALQLALAEQVELAADDCDVALLLVDPREGWDAGLAALWERLLAGGTPTVLAATKGDLAEVRAAPWPPPGTEAAAARLRVSARSGEGLEALLQALVAQLPESPPLYPQDQLSDRSLRFLAAERVREAAFEALEQELPYALAVEVLEFDESRDDLVRIRARLLVERESQKAIAVGRGGAMVKRIGTRARRALEAWLSRQVHLDLRVKVEPHWDRRAKRLKSLGYW